MSASEYFKRTNSTTNKEKITLSHIIFLTQMRGVFCSEAMKFGIFTIFQSSGHFLSYSNFIFMTCLERKKAHIQTRIDGNFCLTSREWNGCKNKCVRHTKVYSAMLQKKSRIFICRCIFLLGVQHNLIVGLFVCFSSTLNCQTIYY